MKKKVVVTMLAGCMILGGTSQVMAGQTATVGGDIEASIDGTEADLSVGGTAAVSDDGKTVALSGAAQSGDDSMGGAAYIVSEDDGSVSLYFGYGETDVEEWYKVSLTGFDYSVIPTDASSYVLTDDVLAGFESEGTEDLDGVSCEVFDAEVTYDEIEAFAEAAGEDMDALCEELAASAAESYGVDISADLVEAVLEGIDIYVEIGRNADTQEFVAAAIDLSASDWSYLADLVGSEIDIPVLDLTVLVSSDADVDTTVPEEALATENVIPLTADDVLAMLQ